MLKVKRGGAFPEALGEHAKRKIKEKNPRKEVYTETITWLKKQWEEIWKRLEDKTEEPVNLFSTSKDGNGTLKGGRSYGQMQTGRSLCR